MPGPSGGWRLLWALSSVGRPTVASRLPPRLMPVRGGYPRRGGLSCSQLRRVKQNLSFVISPSTADGGPGRVHGGLARFLLKMVLPTR